ncbi:hypothetical protein [Paracoccus sp. (in: a-proteobacteria)]|uniref:hypothetical protein n=1 Tax=Paracoccus sp. TaxID=267 RepID=UPI00322075DA
MTEETTEVSLDGLMRLQTAANDFASAEATHTLHARNGGQGQLRAEHAPAVIDVDVVEADGNLPDLDFTLSGGGKGNFHGRKNLWPSEFGKADRGDGLGHVLISSAFPENTPCDPARDACFRRYALRKCKASWTGTT